MANRDVNLVIKAKEQATKAVDSVANALRELADVQKDVGQSAAKTDGLLGKLKNELAALDREARGLAALNKVAGQLDKAAAAVGRLDAAAARAAQDQEKLSASLEKASKSAADARAATEAAKAAYDKQRAAVAALTAEQRKDKTATDAARASRDALKVSLNEANVALKAAERNEGLLRSQLSAAADAADESRVALAGANEELSQIAGLANKASAALGGVEATQAAVAAASARAAGDIERLNAALGRQAGGSTAVASPTSAAGVTSAYRQQIAAVDAAKVAWREAQAEANKLATAIRSTEAPTREQQTAFLLAQAASRAAKQEYLAQGAALNQLRGNLGQYVAAQRQANVVTQQATAGVRQFVPVTSTSGAAMQQAAGQGFRLRDSFKAIYGESRQAMNLFQRLRGEVLSLAAGYVGLYAAIGGIISVINTYTQLEATQSRLGVVFAQNTARVAGEIAWLRGEAMRLGVQFSVLSDEYGKFAFAAQAANFTIEDTRRTFMAMAEAGRVMKVSQEDMGGLFKALTQIMSKGKVQAEELRGQIGDRMSGAFTIFAAALGVTTAELDKMLEAGEVVANRSTIVAFADELNERFGPQLAGSLQSVSAEMGRFSNNLEQAQLRVAQGGFIDGFNGSLKEMNAWFVSEDGIKFFEDIGAALGKLVGILPQVIQNIDKFVLLFQVFAALKVGQVIMSLIGGMGGLSLATAKARTDVLGLTLSMQILAGTSSGVVRSSLMGLTGVMVSLRGGMIALAAAARTMWAAIGGLPGVLITGLTFIVTSLVGKWLTSADKANAALADHDRMMGRVREGYTAASGNVKDWADELKDLSLVELRVNADDLEKSLADSKRRIGATVSDWTDDPLLSFKPDLQAAIVAFLDLAAKVQKGEMSLADFRKETERLANTDPRLDRYAKQLLDIVREGEKSEQSLKENDAAMRALGGTATAADRQLLGLENALDGVNAAADTSAIDAYTAALKKLSESVPDLKVQLDFEAGLKEIDDAYRKALENAGEGTAESIALMNEATRVWKAAREAFIRENSRGSSGSYIDNLMGAESPVQGRNTARPIDPVSGRARSSAVGGSQFIEETWLVLFRRHFPEMASGMTRAAILSLRSDPEMNRRMTELLTEENAAMLARAGFAATDTNKYLAHFLGPSDAIKVLQADRGTPITDIVSPASVRANPEVLGRGQTAGQVIDWSASKMGVSETAVEAQQQVADILADQRRAQEEYNAEIATGISQREFELAQMGRTQREQVIALALRQAETQALEDNVILSDAQREAIVSSTGALYDAQEAERGRSAILERNTELLRAQGVEQTRQEFITAGLAEANISAESDYGRELAHVLGLIYDVTAAETARKAAQQAADAAVSNLQAQQQALMEQITFFQEQGQLGIAGELQIQLEGVNAELLKAVDAALAFYQALDPATNPGAAAAILGLQNVRNGLNAVNTTAITTGKAINESIANGGAQAFDRFSQAIAEGKNVLESARDAFLQFAADFLREIAQMILRQAILNALGGGASGGQGGAGGAIAGWINGLFRHNGGLAGSGGGYKSVWAGHFANATRYHSGGVVGLAPNEVPIIAEKGEEVLDAGDPRHRANGGMSGGPVNFKAVNLFDINDLAEAVMESEVGQKVLLNVVRANPRAFQAALAG